jgi:iron complex outermembrane receptor protein
MNSRWWHWMWVCVCISVTPVGAQQSLQTNLAQQHFSLNIPSQPLEDALNSFGRQTHLKLAFYADLGRGLISPRIAGNYTPEIALRLLLANTGLRFKYLDSESVAILPNDPGANSPASTSAISTWLASGSEAGGIAPPATGTGSSKLGTERSGSTTSDPNQMDKDREHNKENEREPETSKRRISTLEDIVVTAQKRSEKLMDVPTSVSAVSGEFLESLQSYSLTDFAGYVPGLTVAGGGSPGQNTLVIRGLSTGYTNSTTGALVATYVDDVPVGSSISAARGAIFGLDLMPYDIERVEVLRGPQGTLYGADAMGGLIKYSLRKPDLTEFDAKVGTDVEDINGSRHPGGGGRASVNLPVITGTLAMRASGFYQANAGYIDNIGTGTRDANHSTESGGRATLLWKPADSLTVQATVLAQDIHSADQTGLTLNGTTLQPVFGAQARSTLFREPFTQQTREYALSVDWDLHFATLTNSSSWSRLRSGLDYDLTKPFSAYAPQPGDLTDYLINDKASKFTEEMRLASPQSQRIQWLLGGFYTKEDGEEVGSTPTFTSSYVPLPAADNIYIYTTQAYFKERAIFGNATYLITDHFDIGGGGRYAQNTETDCTPVNDGVFGSGQPIPCASRPYAGVATWMADARFHLDRDSMFYLRWATGYRPGGCNNGCVTSVPLETPGSFNPDRVANYEGGFKGEFVDHRLQLDMSVFHIDWRHIQAEVINSLSIAYTGNGGTATSNGFELTTSYQITERLSLQGTLDYTDAHLTQDAPAIGGKNGDQLPESPLWTGSLMAEYRQPFGERRQFMIGGGYRYRDKVVNQFAGTGEPLPIGPQNIVDVHTGLVMNKVSARLYGKNVFNNRSYMGLLYLADPQRPMFVPVQPRTIGLSFDYSF